MDREALPQETQITNLCAVNLPLWRSWRANAPLTVELWWRRRPRMGRTLHFGVWRHSTWAISFRRPSPVAAQSEKTFDERYAWWRRPMDSSIRSRIILLWLSDAHVGKCLEWRNEWNTDSFWGREDESRTSQDTLILGYIRSPFRAHSGLHHHIEWIRPWQEGKDRNAKSREAQEILEILPSGRLDERPAPIPIQSHSCDSYLSTASSRSTPVWEKCNRHSEQMIDRVLQGSHPFGSRNPWAT